MNRNKMAMVVVAGLVLVIAPAWGQTEHCFRQPLRNVGTARVDLQPLFNWWTNTAGHKDQVERMTSSEKKSGVPVLPARPMTAWVRLNGRVEGAAASGWIVNATVEATPGVRTQERIVVRHPPVREKQQFEGLTRQIAQLAATIKRAELVESNKNEATNPYDDRAYIMSSMASVGGGNEWKEAANDDMRRANAIRAQANTANQAAAAAAAQQRSAVEGQRSKIASAGDEYRLDYFGMRTGESLNGLPVYDLGVFAGAMGLQ
jgi:hypothetical protein